MLPTKEQASYFLPFVQAIAEGKTIQFKPNDKPGDHEWIDIKDRSYADWFNNNDFSTKRKFRIKPEPKPPTYRPWKPEEVPVGAVVRWKNRSRYVITAMWNDEIHLNGADEPQSGKDKSPLLDTIVYPDWTYSIDFCKTWLPCGVLVTQEEEGE